MLDRLAEAFNSNEVKEKFRKSFSEIQNEPKKEFYIRKTISFNGKHKVHKQMKIENLESDENEDIPELEPAEETGQLPDAGPAEIPKPIFKNGFCNFSRKPGFSTLCHYEGALYLLKVGEFEKYHVCLPCYKKALTMSGSFLDLSRPDLNQRGFRPIIKPDAEYKPINLQKKFQPIKNKLPEPEVEPLIKSGVLKNIEESKLEKPNGNAWIIPDEPVSVPEPIKEKDFVTLSEVANKNEIIKTKERVMKKSLKDTPKRHYYSVDQERFILENYSSAGLELLTKMFNEKYGTSLIASSIFSKFCKLKKSLKKSGHKPINNKSELPKKPDIIGNIISNKLKQIPEIKVSDPKELLDNGSVAVDIASQLYSQELPKLPQPVNIVEVPKNKLPVKIMAIELWQEINKLNIPDKSKFEARICLHQCVKIIENPDPNEKDLIVQNTFFAV